MDIRSSYVYLAGLLLCGKIQLCPDSMALDPSAARPSIFQQAGTLLEIWLAAML